MESARHEVASAKAAFYPNVNLTALIGFQNLGSGSLLNAGNREFSAGPAIDLPLFDAGRRRSNFVANEAVYEAAVERYNQLLADALRQVADQLTSARSLDAQKVELQAGLATAAEAYQLAVLRYREGVGNYLQVLTTESQLLAERSLEVDLRARELDLSINLVNALGGGFDEAAVMAALPRHGS